jgi:precorrin-6B methylase 2
MRNPDEPLSLAAGVTYSVTAPDEIEITVRERARTYPATVLAILAVASEGRTLRELIAVVGAQAKGTVGWIETTSLAASLVEDGVLVPVGSATGPVTDTPRFRNNREIEMHIELLDDEVRTRAFIGALEHAVRPGDVVVDLGTGNGILAMAAARAGAARVYAIEASPFAAVTEHVFAMNGYADRIRVVRGWSHQVELPERADVLVSEIIGNDPLGEGALRYMPDAAARFLKPGGRVVPTGLAVDMHVLEMPVDDARKHRVGADRLAQWRSSYGFDFGPFDVHAALAYRRVFRRANALATWRVLAEPRRLFSAELAGTLASETTTTVEVETSAPCETATLVLSAVLDMPGAIGGHAFICGGHWRWPVTLLPAQPATRRWRVTATWGALRSGVNLQVDPLD